jgi:hypothetical protein
VSSQRHQYDAKIRSLRSDYNRAFAACMEARDYTVE